MASIEDFASAAAPAIAAIPGLGPVASAGVTALGNLFGAIGADKREMKNKMKIMDYQNNLAIQNWKMQNEYNLPVNQMRRLLDAGLNPHLVYGDGAQTLAANLTQPNADFKGSPYQGVNGLEHQAMFSQIENMKKQNENLDEQNNLLRATVSKTEKEADALDFENFERTVRQPLLARKYYAELLSAEAKAKIDEENAYLKHLESEFAFDYMTDRNNKLHWEAINTQDENGVIKSQQALNDALKRLHESGIEVNHAMAKKLLAEANFASVSAFIKSWDANMVKNGIDPDLAPEYKMLAMLIVAGLGAVNPDLAKRLANVLQSGDFTEVVNALKSDYKSDNPGNIPLPKTHSSSKYSLDLDSEYPKIKKQYGY